MKINFDEDEFDTRQHKLIEMIIRSIINEAKVYIDDPSDLAQLTDNIAFSISTMLDGSENMEVDSKLLKPFLAFSLDDDNKNIVAAEDGSWMHEYVMGFADEIIMDEIDNDIVEDEESSKEPEEVFHFFKFTTPINQKNTPPMDFEKEVMKSLNKEVGEYGLKFETYSRMANDKDLIDHFSCEKCGKYDPFNLFKQ